MNSFFHSNLGLLNLAHRHRQGRICLRSTRLTLAFLSALTRAGLLAGYEVVPASQRREVVVFLKLGTPFTLRPISTPSRRRPKGRGFLEALVRAHYFVCVSSPSHKVFLLGSTVTPPPTLPLGPTGGIPLCTLDLQRP